MTAASIVVGVLPASNYSDKQLQESDANVGFRCLRYRIRFICFRNIKTFVDKIGRRRISVQQEGFRYNKKADGFPNFEPRLNGRIGISGFLGPVRRSARSASGSRTVTSSLVQGDNRFTRSLAAMVCQVFGSPPAAFHLGYICRRLEAFEQ